MAKGFNKVILMGNLTRDVETRTTPNGQSVSNFSIAVTRSWRDQNGHEQRTRDILEVTLNVGDDQGHEVLVTVLANHWPSKGGGPVRGL